MFDLLKNLVGPAEGRDQHRIRLERFDRRGRHDDQRPERPPLLGRVVVDHRHYGHGRVLGGVIHQFTGRRRAEQDQAAYSHVSQFVQALLILLPGGGMETRHLPGIEVQQLATQLAAGGRELVAHRAVGLPGDPQDALADEILDIGVGHGTAGPDRPSQAMLAHGGIIGDQGQQPEFLPGAGGGEELQPVLLLQDGLDPWSIHSTTVRSPYGLPFLSETNGPT